MLEEKNSALQSTAKNLAFHYYIRKGQIPALISHIVQATASTEMLEYALSK